MLVYSKGENFAYHQEEKQTATTTTITTTKAATKVAAGSRQLRLICLTIAKCPAGGETNRVPNGAERDRQLDRETVEQRDSWTGRQTDRQTVKHCDKENCKRKSKENANVFKPRAIISTRSSEYERSSICNIYLS